MVEALRRGRQNGRENGLPIEIASLGQRIITLRESLRLSQARFSVETGLSQGYLSRLENGEIDNLRYKTAISIAQALGIGMDFFEGKSDTKVFLRPEARKLYQIISSLEPDSNRRRSVALAVREFIPDTKPSDTKYIDKITQSIAIGKIIRGGRESMSQGKAAQRSSLSQGHFSQLENGFISSPSIAVLKKISICLNIDIYKLLGLEEKVYPKEIEAFDRFSRSAEFTDEQKAAILNRFTDVLSLILQAPQQDLERIANILIVAAGSSTQAASEPAEEPFN